MPRELAERINDAIEKGPVNICGTSGLLNEIADFWEKMVFGTI